MTETSPVELSIIEVTARKSDYMDLLLIGDESEEMVRRYVDVCNLYVGFVDGVAVSCIAALAIDAGTVEVKNLAVIPESRRRGVGAAYACSCRRASCRMQDMSRHRRNALDHTLLSVMRLPLFAPCHRFLYR